MNPAQRLCLRKRYRGRLRPKQGILDGLGGALHTLLRATPREDPYFLGHGLDLLLERLGGNLAYLVTLEGGVLETRWWAPEGTIGGPKPIQSFCRILLENPHRTLVLRDFQQASFLKDVDSLPAQDIRAALGATLWSEDHVKGLLFVHFGRPQAFPRSDLALLDAVAGFLSRVLEVEDLKSSLRNLETALDITRAVAEDNSIQDAVTDLPNRRYLEIWLKANLAATRRKQRPMTVAELLMPSHTREVGARVREMAESVRGGDLVVSEGGGRFLVLLQRTSRKTGHAFLERLRGMLGPVPMGATIWTPEKDDPALVSVRRRLEGALAQSRSRQEPELAWDLGEGSE